MIFYSTKSLKVLQRSLDGKRVARSENPRENSWRIRQLADLKSSQPKSFSVGIFSNLANHKVCNENTRRKLFLSFSVENSKILRKQHFNFARNNVCFRKTWWRILLISRKKSSAQIDRHVYKYLIYLQRRKNYNITLHINDNNLRSSIIVFVSSRKERKNWER